MHMPSLPRHAELARLLLKQDDVSLPDVAALVKQDPPLTARLLRGVNSAAYSLSEPICEPAHAASVLGVRGLQNLIMRAPTFDEKRVQRETGYDVTELWSTSQSIAALCRWMPTRLAEARQFDADELQIHGLLCDIGRFAMFEGLGNEFAIACKRAREEGRELALVEKESFGFSHNELGAMLVKRWNLPEDFVKTTRFHHNEMHLAEVDSLVAIVYLASQVVEHQIRAEAEVEKQMSKRVAALSERIPKSIHERLELTPEFLEKCLRFLAERAFDHRAA